ncbi:MAG: hypothetical protein HZB62_10740 [Nitrospirae bacterium]|nr:hypothetical protein [Nitrospirota bacterium]
MAEERKEIEAKYLRGLKFRTSTSEVVAKDGGRKVKQFTPVERALEADDVLSWKDTGNAVVIVTADGQKITVQKDDGKKDDGKKGK